MKTENESPDSVSHDTFFRGLMREPIFAKRFLETYLPNDIKNSIDWLSLEIKDSSFIDGEHRKKQSDILYAITLNGQESFVYILLEHQSKPDKFMAFRLLQYMLGIWQNFIDEKKVKQLPPIIPFVFYNGKHLYPYDNQLWSLFSQPKWASRFFEEGFILVDLNTLSDETLLSHKELAYLELPQKYALKKSMQKIFGPLFNNPLFSQVKSLKNGSFTTFMLKYIMKYEKEILPEDFFSQIAIYLSAEEQKNMPTIENRLIEKGKHEGIIQGQQLAIRSVIDNMAKKGLDKKSIADLIGMSQYEIDELEKSD
jgi:predicted transposase/invertase (TIGR01784 family)